LRIIKTKKISDPNAVVPLYAIITGSFLFTGFFPVASGTFGSLAALVILFITPVTHPEVLLPLIVVFFIAGTLSAKPIMKRYGDDPSVIVVDEVVGMWITLLLFLVFGKTEMSMFNATVCFLAFRFFDIFKIQPAKYFDELKSAFGVMMDDVIAGVYAGIFCVLFSMTGINLF
jgi:phosphatidylglycerophosphatase A